MLFSRVSSSLAIFHPSILQRGTATISLHTKWLFKVTSDKFLSPKNK